MNLFHIRALPDLDSNIKSGNSLIDPQFYASQPGDLFSDEMLHAINAFSWTDAFPFLSEGERFDIVLGNPPYLNIDTVWGKKDPRAAAIKYQYPAIYNDKTDIYYYFLARSILLSRKYVAFICSRAFLESYKGDKLRQFIIDKSTVREVVDFQNYPVFRGVGITTAILQLETRKASSSDLVEVFQCQVATNLSTSELKPFDGNFFRQITYAHKRLSSPPMSRP
jgi:type I restriction-modification system DNA methylase subunit